MKCAQRDFRRRLRRDTARASSLPQVGPTCASKTGAKWRQNRRHQESKTTTLSIAYPLAGAPGLEPGNGGIKILRSTFLLVSGCIRLSENGLFSTTSLVSARSMVYRCLAYLLLTPRLPA
jgi:hypothetical protein